MTFSKTLMLHRSLTFPSSPLILPTHSLLSSPLLSSPLLPFLLAAWRLALLKIDWRRAFSRVARRRGKVWQAGVKWKEGLGGHTVERSHWGTDIVHARVCVCVCTWMYELVCEAKRSVCTFLKQGLRSLKKLYTLFIPCVRVDFAAYVCVCVCVCALVCIHPPQHIWIHSVHGSHDGCARAILRQPLRGDTVTAAPLTQSYLPSIPLSLAPFIPLLIPLSNPSLSFHLRSNNISNPYSQPAIPPMAISATALEIFQYTLPAIWLSDPKIFIFIYFFCRFGGRRGLGHVLWHEYMCSLASLSLSFPPSHSLLSLLFAPLFSLCHRWTDRSRWSQQTVRVEEVLYALPPSPPPPHRPKLPFPLLPSFFCSSPTNVLPARISLTIICPIRRCPVPRRGLTARPGRTLQYSERIM